MLSALFIQLLMLVFLDSFDVAFDVTFVGFAVIVLMKKMRRKQQTRFLFLTEVLDAAFSLFVVLAEEMNS